MSHKQRRKYELAFNEETAKVERQLKFSFNFGLALF